MVSTKRWVGAILLQCIPIVNIVLLFVWAFGGNTPESLKNYSKALLIVMGCFIGFYLLIALLIVLASGF